MPKKKTQKEFLSEVYSIVQDEYTPLGEYVNNKTKILMRHNTCGSEYMVTPHMFLSRGRRCPICANKLRGKTLRDYHKKDNYLQNLLDNLEDPNEYTWLEEYKNNNKIKHLIRHNTCQTEYLVRPNDFQQGYRCPFCNYMNTNSKLVIRFENYLQENNINHIQEYKIDIEGKHLSFDFYFPELNLLLELDGMQHFRTNASKSFKKSFDNGIRRDWFKNKYCKENEIPLLRVYHKINNDSQMEKAMTNLKQLILMDKKSLNLIKKEIYYFSNKQEILNEKLYYINQNKEYFKSKFI